MISCPSLRGPWSISPRSHAVLPKPFLAASPIHRRYATSAQVTYENALDLLNRLQTPYDELKSKRDAGFQLDETAHADMKRWLGQTGHTLEDLNRLNIIHVAGTKGKGSTCAYTNSIICQYLRAPYKLKKVGLFTSPHLVSVRERIRINSDPITPSSFATYFFEIWKALSKESKKPSYFRFLTLMSYQVFLREEVDIAVYETGLGGQLDSTNIVPRPAVTGITSLGIDHVFTLGSTLPEIAWHKAGIQKAQCPSLTVVQPREAFKVIKERAEEIGVSSLEEVGIDGRLDGVRINPDLDFQKSNASLAVRLAETSLAKCDIAIDTKSGKLPAEFKRGLESAVLRGRCEIKVNKGIRWHLDGAHTPESIEVAAEWFRKVSRPIPGIRVLVFNQQGLRNATQLLDKLFNSTVATGFRFDHVIFCPTSSRSGAGTRRDFINYSQDASAITDLRLQNSFADTWRAKEPFENTGRPAQLHISPSTEDALDLVRDLKKVQEDGRAEMNAYVTGSLHLVGRVIEALDGIDAA